MLIIAKVLDAESLDRYNLSVEVTDGLSTATVQVDSGQLTFFGSVLLRSPRPLTCISVP